MKAFILLLITYCGLSVAQLECDSDEIACADEGRCIPFSYICDRDDDCSDDSDEEIELCEAWRNDDCSKGEVKCDIRGSSNCIQITEYCKPDSECNGNLDRRICQMIENGKVDKLVNIILPSTTEPGNLNKSEELANRFQDLIPNTLSHINCPTMYTWVGDQCLSIFHIGSMSWGESREFCRILKGDLITFKNISHYSTVVQHLQQQEITTDFWIGGRNEEGSKEWTWLDGAPMPLGSPYWATRYSQECVERNVTVAKSEESCFRYYQAPEAEPVGQCVGLSFEQFFYMSDDDCLKKMSPLCVYQGEEGGPKGPL